MTDSKKIICHTIKGEVVESSAANLSFRPSAYGVIIKDGKVLLSPQWDGYDFPGGGIDLGEKIEDGLIREVKEETGIDVLEKEVLLATDDFFVHPYSEKHLHTILIFYLCEVVGGEISTEGFDENEKKYAQKAVWVPLEEVSNLKFYNPIDSPKLIEKASKVSLLV